MMKEVKLTKKERATLGGYNRGAKWIRPFTYCGVIDTDGGGFSLRTYVRIVPYIILFIPVHLFEIITLLWDGGLKNFEIIPRYIGYDYISWGSPTWLKVCDILGYSEEEKNEFQGLTNP